MDEFVTNKFVLQMILEKCKKHLNLSYQYNYLLGNNCVEKLLIRNKRAENNL